MVTLIQSPWLATLVGTLLYLIITVVFLNPKNIGTPKKPDLKTEEEVATVVGPSWFFQNPELDKLVNEIRAEKSVLVRKEQELKELEARLQIEKREVSTITQSVDRIKKEMEAKIAEMQKEFEQNTLLLKAAEMVNLKKLAKMHSTMSPEGSANLLKQMPDNDAVKILSMMKVEEVSVIMDAMSKMGAEESKKASTFMDKLRRVVPPTSSGTGDAKQGG